MWHTVESDKSTIRNGGELGCRLAYKNLSEILQLPSFEAMTVGLSGDFSSLMKWTENMHVQALPFTFEKDKRIKFDLVSKAENILVGSIWYGASKTISATFGRTSDAKDILEMPYRHWLISYSELGSDYTSMSIREIVGNL
jgi:hypothetical protein